MAESTERLWLKDVTKVGEYMDELANHRNKMMAMAEKAEAQENPQMIHIITETISIIDRLKRGIMASAEKQIAEMERQINEAKAQMAKDTTTHD